MSDSKNSTDPNDPTRTPSVRQRAFYMLRLVAQPLLFFAAGVALLALLGFAQRVGWISAGGSGENQTSPSGVADVDYICPMMCTPPQKEPGRCPVCAMELVPASGGGAGGDERSVVVDPATRRVANIQTVSVQRIPLRRTIRAVGEVGFDEGKMKTIAAYTTGRFDKMYVDYTGAVVKQGDRLAEFYSPELYSAQVEFLQASDATNRVGSTTLTQSIAAVTEANQQLKASSRQRLIEFGMSNEQIEKLLRDRQPVNRLDIVAPMQGTVIERLAVEGEYVQEGQAVFRLADLSTVWLLLELFPEDAAAVRYGQKVEARLKSMPEQTFAGRIAFVAPEVNTKTRTVSVRVVFDNSGGKIRIGDYAKATIEVPVGSDVSPLVYDPDLANKWISPRHPHIIRDAPGPCPLCGVNLVAASDLGFTDEPQTESMVFVVPRNAVLSAANQSIIYVETETGRFEIRQVVTGPAVGQNIVVVKGLAEGEKVATSGNFLIDSQMQLAGNPSLIDPSSVGPAMEMIAGFSAKELAEIHQLPDNEQPLAIDQIICPVTEYKLGSMGVPKKVDVNGLTIFICCEACRSDVLEMPDVHIAKLDEYKMNGPSESSGDDAFAVPEIGEITSIDDVEENGFPPIEAIQGIGSDESEDATESVPTVVEEETPTFGTLMEAIEAIEGKSIQLLNQPSNEGVDE